MGSKKKGQGDGEKPSSKPKIPTPKGASPAGSFSAGLGAVRSLSLTTGDIIDTYVSDMEDPRFLTLHDIAGRMIIEGKTTIQNRNDTANITVLITKYAAEATKPLGAEAAQSFATDITAAIVAHHFKEREAPHT